MRASFRRHGKNGKKGISEIIATLLMILVVVGMGTTVFVFASGGLTNYGTNFASIMGTSGNQISEFVVVEQITYVNTGNPTTSGANLYVRDIGTNPTVIVAVYVQNSTASSFVEQFTSSPLPATINSGSFQIIFVNNFVPDHGIVYVFTLATSLGNTVNSNAMYY